MRLLATGVILKGILMATVVALLDVTFIKSLILVVASSTASGFFAFIVARYTTASQQRQDRTVHGRLDTLERNQDDIAAKIGARNRRTDPPEILG